MLPPGVGRVDHEAELAVVIGRRAHRVPRAQRLGLHLRHHLRERRDGARHPEPARSQYTRAQGLRHVRADRSVHRGRRDRRGPRRSKAGSTASGASRPSTAQLIFPIDHLVEYITFVMTLEPGDIISTGTPSGVGPLAAGDVVTVKVEGVGELTNPVRDETDDAQLRVGQSAAADAKRPTGRAGTGRGGGAPRRGKKP